MTFAQIEKTREFLIRLENVHGIFAMTSFISELRAYYDLFFNISLNANIYNALSTYSSQFESEDKAAIKCFLESRIDENDLNRAVLDVLELIEEGKKAIKSGTNMAPFVSKAFYSYNGKIRFDKTTETAATAPSDAFDFCLIQVDSNMVNGVIVKLKDYGMSLIGNSKDTRQKNSPSVIINNSNNATANSNSSVDFSISIEQARQKAEDAGLSDQQYDDIMKKLSEIEDLEKSNESKGHKWNKAKNVLKWCAEQGIEIAKIMLPLLPQMFGK